MAPTLPARDRGRGYGDFETGGGIVGEPEPTAYDPNQMTSGANRSNPKPGRCHALPATHQPPIIVRTSADVAPALTSRPRSGGIDPHSAEDGALIVEERRAATVCGDRTHPLTASGHDASEDGSGRGTPIVGFSRSAVKPESDALDDCAPPIRAARSGHPAGAFSTRTNSVDPATEIAPTMTAKGFGHTAVGVPEPGREVPDLAVFDPQQVGGACNGAACMAGREALVPTLTARNPIAIAFGSRDSGDSSEELSPTIRAASHDRSHENGGAPPAVALGWQSSNPIVGDLAPTLTGKHRGDVAAFSWSTRDAAPSPTTAPTLTGRQNNLAVALRGRDGGAAAECSDAAPALRTAGGGSSQAMVTDGYRVRRLTPRECERLMGMPDDWTAIDGASDSARYTAIGNAMAVPVLGWIGERILQARGGRPFRYLSVCSGVEALTLAWAPLGCVPVLVSEIARFPRRVLERRLGAVPLSRSK